MPINLLVGCKTEIPNNDDMFFNIEMEAEEYPSINDRDRLRNFLNSHTREIIDDVVYVIDKSSGSIIWDTGVDHAN